MSLQEMRLQHIFIVSTTVVLIHKCDWKVRIQGFSNLGVKNVHMVGLFLEISILNLTDE